MSGYQELYPEESPIKKRVNFKDTTETRFFPKDRENSDLLARASGMSKILFKIVLYGGGLILGIYCAYLLLMGIIFTFCFMLIFLIKATGGFLGLINKEKAIESIDRFGYWIVGA
ncbi:hypothetical protein CLIB1444_07S02498 [[Candida] jaroonii]|uniref:Uncharacterized protein n=1 Tax=[Candida] jaroonii TaxID=467808 RepID=A0ACA9YAC7_9ASCO|nr:hypothetical protein CLIB1444_07S02498 [[Candida] jaroonii]